MDNLDVLYGTWFIFHMCSLVFLKIELNDRKKDVSRKWIHLVGLIFETIAAIAILIILGMRWL